MTGEVRLELLSHPEVEELDRERTVVLVPTGAIEQHGPHLPLDTDAFMATGVSRAAARRAAAAGPTVVAPTLCFGASEHHMAFPGTLTLRPQTFGRAVADVLGSLGRHGFRRLLVVNGHGGNVALLAATVQELGFSARVRAAFVNYWDAGREEIERIRRSPTGGMGHAGEFETSLMLHLRPEAVRTDLIRREIPEPRYGSESFDLLRRGPLTAHWKTHELSSSGVLGAPDLADAERGRRFFEACVAGVAAIVEQVRAASPS